MNNFNRTDTPCILPNSIMQAADMPYALYQSLQGKYFVGFAADVQFNNKYGWAGLVNPSHSGVNLHVYVWTVTNFGEYPLNAAIWFNADLPKDTEKSQFITPANTAICPLPRPRVEILQTNFVDDYPPHGNKAFVKTVLPEVTIVGEEDGSYIFPPGGSFSVFLTNTDTSNKPGIANVAFGWYEEKIK